jgi:hypothetical protein
MSFLIDNALSPALATLLQQAVMTRSMFASQDCNTQTTK